MRLANEGGQNPCISGRSEGAQGGINRGLRLESELAPELLELRVWSLSDVRAAPLGALGCLGVNRTFFSSTGSLDEVDLESCSDSAAVASGQIDEFTE